MQRLVAGLSVQMEEAARLDKEIRLNQSQNWGLRET
jgi:hypothetical protein